MTNQAIEFNAWLTRVNAIFARDLGFPVGSRLEHDWRGLYEAGKTPEAAFNLVCDANEIR